MDEGLYFEEYAEGWSQETRSTPITEEGIGAFVALHGFNTPTYTDPKYMKMSYGGRMAPGLMVLCAAEGLVLDAGVTRRRGIFLVELYPKFKKPVYAGDSVINRIRFKSKRLTSKPERGIVVTEHEVLTQKGELAIVYDAIRIIRTLDFIEADTQAD
jgi:itaconyl-CoA hydratase